MPNTIHEINVNINGADAGTSQSTTRNQETIQDVKARATQPRARSTGAVSQTPQARARGIRAPGIVGKASRVFTQVGAGNYSLAGAATLGVALSTFNLGSEWASQSANLRGASTQGRQIAETQRNINFGASLATTGLIALQFGGPVAAGIAVATQLALRAFEVAKETREYVRDQMINKFQSQYYSDRLISGISERRF